MAPKRRQPHSSKPDLQPVPVILGTAVYGILFLFAILAISHSHAALLPGPTASPTVSPTIDPSLNHVAGDFVVVDGWNSCKTSVKLAATSQADGTNASGTFELSAVGGPSWCAGQAKGRITCLLVNGNAAMFSGWVDETSDSFNIGNVLQGDIVENDPQTYGPPVDRAFISLASGSPECPPALSGPGGPQIISGTLTVSPARPSAS